MKPDPEEYKKTIEEWDTARLERLRSASGWLNLAGLFWLQEGMNTLGSDSLCDIIIHPDVPLRIGTIYLDGDALHFESHPGVEIFNEDRPVGRIELLTDQSGDPTLLAINHLRWFVIERGGKYAIRLRDLRHPNIAKLETIERYPVNPDWRVKARFHSYKEPRTMVFPTVVGIDEEVKAYGRLTLRINGERITLYPSGEPDNLFLIFGDETSAITTYPGGRFLNAEGPVAKGRVTLDFNKAYNPPCAFTQHATCPLPIKENLLGIHVEAGEKDVHILH